MSKRLKDTLNRLKWIYNQSKTVTRYLMIIVIFAAIAAIIGIYRAIVSKQLIDAATESQGQKLYYVIGIFGLLIIIELAIRSFASIATAKCSVEISNNVRRRLYGRIMKTKWMELSKYHSGDILTRITSDVDAVSTLR